MFAMTPTFFKDEWMDARLFDLSWSHQQTRSSRVVFKLHVVSLYYTTS